MKSYILVLGKHRALSRAELAPVCDEVFFDESLGLLYAENLVFKNPRKIPRSPEQLFLDQLGGTIRMAEVIGEFHSRKDILREITNFFVEQNRDGVQYLGLSTFGTKPNFAFDLFPALTKEVEKATDNKLRIENKSGKPLDSGRIFNSKLLKKGAEFIVWQNKNSFLLARTVANQNLRNYVLRDRDKGFRDAHMGMLPPKLAQILLNLATNNQSKVTVVDPFCGSGTINHEAAISGFKTLGSDINPDFLAGAKRNHQFLAEKFRYDPQAPFFVCNAQDFPWNKYPNSVIATEGWLGENFRTRPTNLEIEHNAQKIITLWSKIFETLAQNKPNAPQRIATCIPTWNAKQGSIKILEKIFAKAKNCGYNPLALFDKQNHYSYKRAGAFVTREIVVFEKQ